VHHHLAGPGRLSGLGRGAGPGHRVVGAAITPVPPKSLLPSTGMTPKAIEEMDGSA